MLPLVSVVAMKPLGLFTTYTTSPGAGGGGLKLGPIMLCFVPVRGRKSGKSGAT